MQSAPPTITPIPTPKNPIYLPTLLRSRR